MYRLATEDELTDIADNLSHFQLWSMVKGFIKQYYSDDAYSFTIESEGQYDDQGGYDYNVDSIQVFTASGEDCPLDLSKPAFAIVYGGEQNIPEAVYDEDYSDILEQLEEYWGQNNDMGELIEWQEFPMGHSADSMNVTFYVDTYDLIYPIYVKVK